MKTALDPFMLRDLPRRVRGPGHGWIGMSPCGDVPDRIKAPRAVPGFDGIMTARAEAQGAPGALVSISRPVRPAPYA